MRAAAMLLVLLGLACPPAPRPGGAAGTGRTDASLPPGTTVLPDSLSGLGSPRAIVLNPGNARLYVGGDYGIAVIDAATGRKTGLLRLPGVGRLWLNPLTNRLYAEARRGDSDWSDLVVVDCTADTVVAVVEQARLWPVCANVADNKVYAVFSDFWHWKLAVIDGRTNRVVKTIRLGSMAGSEPDFRCIWNPASDAVYLDDRDNGTILAIDGSTDRVRARIVDSRPLWVECLNPNDNKLYARAGPPGDSTIVVIECRTDRVSARLPVGLGLMAMLHVPAQNKLYCSVRTGTGADFNGVVVVDGAGDSLLARIVMPGEPDELVHDSVHGRVYCFAYAGEWVAVIDCRTDSVLDAFRPGTRVGPAAYYAPASRLYALNWAQGDVYVVDGSDFSVVDTLVLDYRVETVLYNRRYDRLYCADAGGHSLCVVEGASGRVRGTIRVGIYPAVLCVNRDETRLYCADDSGTVSVIDCAADRVVARVPVGRRPTALCYSAKHDRLFVAVHGDYGDARDSTIAVIDCRTNSVVASLAATGQPRCLAYDSVHDRVYCASAASTGTRDSEGRMDGFDAGTLEKTLSTRFLGYPRSLCYDPVHDRLYCAHTWPHGVTPVDCRTGRADSTLPAGDPDCDLCLDPARNRLYFASRLVKAGPGDDRVRTVSVVDTETGRRVASVPVPREPTALYHVPATDRVYCACSRDSVVVIDGRTDRVIARLASGRHPSALDYSPALRTVFVANAIGGSVTPIVDDDTPAYRR